MGPRATGYRYNDEAGMPFSYLTTRTYTWLYNYLSEADRQKIRDLMAIRGQEMYNHLSGKLHIWKPYDSHANRAWHKLGEVGAAFYGEIPDAANWVWFAMNVFYNSYPVWNDDAGGWHEGIVLHGLSDQRSPGVGHPQVHLRDRRLPEALLRKGRQLPLTGGTLGGYGDLSSASRRRVAVRS